MSKVAISRLAEDWRLSDGKADIQPDEDEDSAGKKRDSPAKREELFVGEQLGEQQEDSAGEQEADGSAKLGKHAVPGALTRRGVFDREENGASPFATESETLTEATEREQQRSGDANARVGRQQSDGNGGDSHGEQGGHQRGFAADAIAEVAENGGAEGTREEGDGEGSKRCKSGSRGVGGWKEQPREYQHGSGCVDVEIEELDGGADHAGKQNLPGRV